MSDLAKRIVKRVYLDLETDVTPWARHDVWEKWIDEELANENQHGRCCMIEGCDHRLRQECDAADMPGEK